MKETKICIIATIITVVIILSCTFAFAAQAEELPEFYPKLTIVINTTRIADSLWTVDCLDKQGNIWAFYDEEGTWAEGDIANLLMRNTNEHEETHEIAEVYWEGYTENVTEWLHMMEW